MRLRAWAPSASGLVVAGSSVVVASIATRSRLEELRIVCTADLCNSLQQPTPDLLDQVSHVGLTRSGWAVVVVTADWALLLTFCALGLVMMWRRPSRLAVVCGVGLMLVAVQDFLSTLEAQGLAVAVVVVLAGLNQASLFLILALFPNGRWHPGFLRRWWVPVLVAISAPSMFRAADVGIPVLDAVETPAILLMVVAQVHRYLRRSDWVMRQQTKWVLIGFGWLAGVMLASLVLGASGVLSEVQLVLVIAVYCAFFTIGIGFTFAVLRYRLYDVGLLLWRTVTYAAGSAAVLVAYFVFVVLAGMSMAGQTASIVGIAALAAAAVGGAWIAERLRSQLRKRLYGAGNVAAALASSISETDGSIGLAETIAHTLALPHVEVRDRSGTAVSTFGDAPTQGVVREPVIDASGEHIGELLLAPSYGDALDARDRRALAEVRPFVVLVLRAQREAENLKQARIAAAASREDERRRMRRDLHDGVGPLLASQLITLDTIKIAERKGVHDGDLYTALENQTRAAIGEIRSITRALRPPALDAGGLAAALTEEVARMGIPVSLTVELGDQVLSAVAEVNVLRIVQEALTNVSRHSQASQVTVSVVARPGAIQLEVSDDGVGCVGDTAGVGTASMRERAEELAGELLIGAGPNGRGTTVTAWIPA